MVTRSGPMLSSDSIAEMAGMLLSGAGICLQDYLQDSSAAKGLGKHSCDSILSFLQNAKQTGEASMFSM